MKDSEIYDWLIRIADAAYAIHCSHRQPFDDLIRDLELQRNFAVKAEVIPPPIPTEN